MMFILSLIVLVVAVFTLKKGKDQKWGKSIPLIITFSVLIAFSQFFTVVPAGHVGVVDFFGSVSDSSLKPGINFVNPLARVIKMSIQTQEIMETAQVPSKEGLNIVLDVSVLYHLNPEKAPIIYKTVGENYKDIILIPQFRSVIREVTSSFEAKALYTSMRENISVMISRNLTKLVTPRGIEIEATPSRNVTLPQRLMQSIEEKLRAEQESQRMEWILNKEKLEAERKKIEAKGIADFQAIVTLGISDQLLRWKGIEATEKLANSPNTKVIIIGGKDGLPLIMDAR
jgi:regulator of protease activity HflC (stomatin/prohibitin superfamily)